MGGMIKVGISNINIFNFVIDYYKINTSIVVTFTL